MAERAPSNRNFLAGAARAYRVGMEMCGTELLGKFLGQLNEALETGQVQLTPPLLYWLTELEKAQLRNDHLRIADILEYELAP